MTQKEHLNVDAEAILKTVAEVSATFQKTLTPEERALMNRPLDGGDELPAAYAAEEGELAESDFELASAAEALRTLAGQIESVIDRRMQAAYAEGLRVYYVAEELARDPEHAELIPHVEAMRNAHQAQYGRPIPPKKEE
jgi:hypothetical protein